MKETQVSLTKQKRRFEQLGLKTPFREFVTTTVDGKLLELEVSMKRQE